MAMSFAPLLMMLVLGGGPRDLLELMPTDAYWQQKAVTVSVETMMQELQPPAAAGDIGKLIAELGSDSFEVREATSKKIAALGPGVIPQLKAAAESKDAEVSTRATKLIEELTTAVKAQGVRRLMAIRTLGELKKQEALAALKPLLTSKEMFEAEYAARAIAAIEGKPFTVPGWTKEARAADLQLLPAKSALIGQISPSVLSTGTEPFSLDKALEKLAPMAPMMGAGGGGTPEQIRQQAVEIILKGLEQVGNIRLDGVSFALAEDMSGPGKPDNGFFVVVVRGQYDRKAVAAAIPIRPNIGTRETKDGVELVRPDRDVTLLMPADDRLILLVGPSAEKLPVDEVLAALKAGKGTDEAGKNLAAMSKLADTTAPLWLAVRMSDSYRQVPLVNVFDTLGLEGRIAEGALTLKATAQGKDAAQVKATVEAMQKGVADGLAEIKKAQQQMPPALAPMIQTVVDVMESVKLEATDTKATGGATIKGGGAPLMMGLPFFLLSARTQAMPVPMPPPAVPTPPAPIMPQAVPAPMPAPAPGP